jgi:hypothetical protein
MPLKFVGMPVPLSVQVDEDFVMVTVVLDSLHMQPPF